VRMVVVLALLRQAIGTQMLPPSQVITGLAIFLTILAMAPTWEKVRSTAVQPYLRGETTQMQAITTAGEELRGFMFAQIEAADNVEDVYMMYEYATQKTLAAGETIEPASVPLTALIPAFLLSELKASFVIGFRIYLPFLVVDLVIATILVAMGMMMLPPVVISLPFKLLLFVLADGWHLVAGALLASVAN
jgi:flagellar biosynthetic protein FliP